MDMVTKAYGSGTETVVALDQVTLGLRRGSVSVIIGPPGAGKSVLAACVTGQVVPSSGKVFRHDPVTAADRGARAALRAVSPFERRLVLLDGLDGLDGAGAGVVQRLREAAGPLGPTVLITTRDPEIAACGDVALFLVGGRIVEAMSDTPAPLIAERLERFGAG